MQVSQRTLMHVALLSVGGSGVVYAVIKYFLPPPDEFSLAHPWQALWQHTHILLAPLLVFAIGMIWQDHIWRKFKTQAKRSRRSGLIQFVLFAPMILSGYAIQISVSEQIRNFWVIIHVLSSSLFLVVYIAHVVAARNE